MPAQLYSISFKKTGSVLAFCSLTAVEEAKIPSLVDTLVGNGFPVSFGAAASAVAVAASELLADAVLPPLPVVTEPFGYCWTGTPRRMDPVGVNIVKSISLDKTTSEATVELSYAPLAADGWLIYENRLLKSSIAGAAITKFTFALPIAPVGGTSYPVVFFMAGVATDARIVTA